MSGPRRSEKKLIQSEAKRTRDGRMKRRQPRKDVSHFRPATRLERVITSPYENGLGLTSDYLYRRGWVRSAKLILRIALVMTPGRVSFLKRMTAILHSCGKYDLALKYANEVAERQPGNAAVLAHLASLHEQQGNLELAEATFNAVPDGEIEKLRFKARRLWLNDAYKEIVAILERSDEFENQVVHAHYAMENIEAAHRYYRTRPRSRLLAHTFHQPNPLDLVIRDTRNLERSAFVMVDSGIGDELRMTSVYSDLRSCFASLTMTCDPRVYTLLSRSFPDIDFIPVARYRKLDRKIDMSDRTGVTPAGLHLCMNDEATLSASLAEVVFSLIDSVGELRTRREDFHRGPALRPDPNLKAEWQIKVSAPRPQIGIAWRSMLRSPKRDVNYFLPEDLAPLSKLDADFWILQPFANPEELAALREHMSVKIPELDLKDDIESQAALMSCLDVVISPLTTTAELAASVGTQTVFLAPTKEGRWRKNSDGRDVWYPTGWLVQGDPIEDRLSLTARATELTERLLNKAKDRTLAR